MYIVNLYLMNIGELTSALESSTKTKSQINQLVLCQKRSQIRFSVLAWSDVRTHVHTPTYGSTGANRFR